MSTIIIIIAGISPDTPVKNVASCQVKDTISNSPVTENEGCYWGGGGVRSNKNHNKRKGRLAGVHNLYERRVLKEN